MHFGGRQPWDAAAYHTDLAAVDADPYLALTKQIVEHVKYLLANRGQASGIAPLLHPDLRFQRVLNFGLSREYWDAGRASECNPSWLAHYHPEAPEADPAADPEALVTNPLKRKL